MSRMMEQTDLLYRNQYEWVKPSSGLGDCLDKNNGNDMLAFINDMLLKNPLWGSPQARELEVMIRVYLPHEIRQKEAVRRWIYENMEDLSVDVGSIILDMSNRI